MRGLSGVGLTDINSFLVSPSLVSLPSDFVSSEWPNLLCLGPPRAGCLVPLRADYIQTLEQVQVVIYVSD